MSREDRLHKKICSKLKYPITNYTPSLRIQAYSKGKLKIDYQNGDEYRYYDLASLTKPIFTVSAFMKLHEQDQHILKMDVGEILGWSNFQGVNVEDLLNHRSGLIWWRAYFKKNWKGSWLQRRQQLSNLLQKETCKVQKTATYSDVDYLTLGFVLETLLNKNLLNCWQQLNQYFPSNDFHFLTQRPQHNYLYAPTFSHQKGHKWVQALVNDANTQAFGGISSHAGLFGQIEDVSTWLLSLRESLYKDKGFVKRKTLKHFMKRSMKPHQGDWALGFMLPGKNSTSGKYFSKSSIGHLGFTGTSFWWDPKKDVFIVLLANRYINSQKGEEFRNLRPLIHNEIMELI